MCAAIGRSPRTMAKYEHFVDDQEVLVDRKFHQVAQDGRFRTQKDPRPVWKHNVFINSYFLLDYPTFCGDCSEDGKTAPSYDSQDDDHADKGNLGLAGLTETATTINVESEKRHQRSIAGTTTPTTIGSKTYVMQSRSSGSDVRWIERKPQVEESNEVAEVVCVKCKRCGTRNRKTVTQELKLLSPVDCFARLHRRIDILENLLHQALVTGNALRAKGETKPKRKDGFRQKKPKNDHKKVPVSTSASSRPAKHSRHTENSDTEMEILNIKERLKNLEKKLMRETESLLPHRLCDEPSYVISEKMSEVIDISCSQTISLFRFARMSTSPDIEEEQDYEGRDDFFSQYNKLKKKCSSLLYLKNKSSDITTILGEKLVWDDNKKANYQAFRRHSYPGQGRGIRDGGTVEASKGDSDSMTELKKGKKKKKKKRRRYLCKKNSRTNVLQNVRKMEGRPGIWRKKSYWRKRLQTPSEEDSAGCFAYTTAPMMEKKRQPETSEGTVTICRKSRRRRTHRMSEPKTWAVSDGSTYWTPWPFWIPMQRNLPEESEKNEMYFLDGMEAEYKTKGNPLEVLKRGGKIKVPVLFEEICKTKKEKDDIHSASTISMRFVLVGEDNKNSRNPMRKLIKKLSHSGNSSRAEQYVFGVSMCGCDDQMYNLTPFPESEYSPELDDG